jgi:putative membrane protein
MFEGLPYAGAGIEAGELLSRFNPDPVVIVMVLAAASLQGWLNRGMDGATRRLALFGWLLLMGVFVTPLCALSVALFSARLAQQMLMILVAAPLIARGMPRWSRPRSGWPLWSSALSFFVAVWFWHMPDPYQATFGSVAIYWSMQLTLFGSALFLWTELLRDSRVRTVEVFVVGAVTSLQVGLLGAVLTLATRALFRWHLTTTWSWGLTPLQDQQLGGVFMWVPAIALFMWTATRAMLRLWAEMEPLRSA